VPRVLTNNSMVAARSGGVSLVVGTGTDLIGGGNSSNLSNSFQHSRRSLLSATRSMGVWSVLLIGGNEGAELIITCGVIGVKEAVGRVLSLAMVMPVADQCLH